MTKAELTEQLLDYMIDEGRDDPEDYLDINPIDLDYAKVMMKDIATFENECDIEDDERIAHLVTPQFVMDTFNCLLRARKHEARVKRLAEWLTDNECVCEHDAYFGEYENNDPTVVPTDFLCNELKGGFFFDDDASIDDIIEIGMNSKSTFRFEDAYCWYDKDKKQLFSSDTPFARGIIDAEAMANHILLDADAFGYMFDNIIPDDEIENILGCTKEEYINEQF